MNAINKKLKIVRVPVSKLLKAEVSYLGNKVLRIVEKHDPELLQLEPTFNLLEAQRAQIGKLNVRYGNDPVRLALIPLREKLVLCASAVKLHLKTLAKTTDKQKLFLITTAINASLLHLNAFNVGKELESKVSGFLGLAKNNQELTEALEEFGFMGAVDNLELAFNEMLQMSGKREGTLSHRHKESTDKLSNDVLSAIDTLLQDIEVAPFRNPELNYEPLVDELNVMLSMLRRTISLRDARNKRLAAQKKGEALETENAAEVQITAEDSSGTIITPLSYVASFGELNTPIVEESKAPAYSNGSGSEKNNGESLDKKKTVAEMGNQLQQPLGSFNNDNV